MGVQTGGGIEVNPDGSGGGVRGLTQDEIDKLNSVEFGSQVNPKNVMKWASQDANTLSAVSSGEIGFIDSSDAQYQTGDLANIGADGKIRIANLQGTFGTNITQPGVALDSQDVTQFLEDRATNGGPVILALSPFGGTDIVYVQTELVAKITDGYELTQNDVGWQLYTTLLRYLVEYRWRFIFRQHVGRYNKPQRKTWIIHSENRTCGTRNRFLPFL